MAYLLIAMCFFIVKLELNESKQTVEKIKFYQSTNTYNKTIFRYSVSSCLRQT